MDRRTVLVNFRDLPVAVPIDAPVTVEVASNSTAGAPWDGALGPSAAVVLNPRVSRDQQDLQRHEAARMTQSSGLTVSDPRRRTSRPLRLIARSR